MAFKSTLLLALLPFVSSVLAQTPATATVTTSVGVVPSTTQQLVIATDDTTPSQRSAFEAGIRAYVQSFEQTPEFTNLAVLFLGLPGDVRASVTANAESALLPISGTIDLESLATAPPLTFPTQSWETYLGSAGIDSIKSFQTSAALALATLAQQQLSITTSISVPTSTTTNAAARPTKMAGALGAGAAAFGAAALFL